ncbi:MULTISPECIES: FAD-binding oxidoreductase [Marinomonas]|uniref:D-lactate dehydrogenase (cytochrome) n=2 Tax=Marinomonas TaxID=28253 RepID=A0A366D273_9GAMM|nr:MULTISPECIES: FAD-binding oxidoreductase [Marinomonas]AEF55405.1 FAD linked oxidase domain protein [Marinomonas posidonica IVIA-Po-181]RBO84046.1 FAD/FMN-containing dehydrogenase [Marinomonas aquiplantarum]
MINDAFPLPKFVTFENATIAKEFLGVSTENSLKVQGIARPEDEQQVQQLVQWANEHEVTLVPLSSPSGNRRHGLAGLKDAPFVVLDMSKMSRVIHADGEDAIAIIEPGVTFPEFDAQLQKHNLRSIKPFLPRASKSVLACYLEREPTTLPNEHWDSTDPLASLSLTMGSGESFRTGGAALYEDLDEALKNGARQMMASGPIGTDYTRVMLGSQGTLGVTSWASIYCQRIPSIEQGFLYGAEDVTTLISIVRHLALHQLGAQYFMLSRVQLAAALAKDSTHFAELHQLFGKDAMPAWYLYVNIASRDVLPEESMQWQLADLSSLVDTLPVTTISQQYPSYLAELEARLSTPSKEFYKDVPCGTHTEVFCITQMSKVANLVNLAQNLLADLSDVQVGFYLQPMIQGTNCHLDISLFHTDEQTTQLADIEMQLVKVLADNGGFFSRPYGKWSEDAFARNETIVPHLRRVKDIFDPAGILSPGKLCY